jgi:Tfp pilus assembly PilM family ATPase
VSVQFLHGARGGKLNLEDAIAKSMGVDWAKAEAMMRSKGWVSPEEATVLQQRWDNLKKRVQDRLASSRRETNLFTWEREYYEGKEAGYESVLDMMEEE